MIHFATIWRTRVYLAPDVWHRFRPIQAWHDALPPMTPEEAAEVDAVYQGTRLRLPGDTSRPFRGPHYTVSPAGMFGSGSPGELRLAVRGTLVLADAHLFRPPILRALAGVLRVGATPYALVLVLPER